jgi:ABC-type uncharacterized transport system ATPase subunit
MCWESGRAVPNGTNAPEGVVSMTTAIAVSGLVKDFGPRTRALDGLDLQVETGEVHGFLGPNGAGKTTTIRVLLGLLRADYGPWPCSVVTHGTTRPGYIDVLPTSPAR